MRAMRTSFSSPPLHVHVNETTPVHVHVNKSTKKSPNKTTQVKSKPGLRSTAKVKTRVPWIPPGKVTTRQNSFKQEGPPHHLEIKPQSEPKRSQSPLRLKDLSTNEEALQGHISQYEKKMESLMTEVSSLKNEVQLHKTEQQLERLSTSQHVNAERKEELWEVTREVEATEDENSYLRESLEKMLVENNFGRGRRSLQSDKDALVRKLVEAEMDSGAAVRQVLVLHETLCQMSRSERKTPGSDTSLLAQQKDVLLQKLGRFDSTNRSLRRLLREQHSREMNSLRLLEQKDVLMKRISEVEAENSRTLDKLQSKEMEVNRLSSLLENEKESLKTTREVSRVLGTTQAHLKEQLLTKETENNRLHIQIRNLERSISQQQGEMKNLQEQLRDLRQHAKNTKEKHRLEMEITQLNSCIADLTEQLRGQEGKARSERDALLDRHHELTTENATVLLENQSLKATLSALEEKLTLSQSEVQQIKGSVKQYEILVDSYKAQVLKTRAEANEYCEHLQAVEREARTVRENLDQEILQVKKQLVARLLELEPLPEALRRAELQLQEALEKEHAQEKTHTELHTSLAELHSKVEQQNSQVEMMRHKNAVLVEESKQLQQKADALERKLKEANSQNQELMQVIAKREETIHSNQKRLEEKHQECSVLTRQLEETLKDSHRQVNQTRERVTSKERAAQSKAVDLETQLSRTTAELNQLQRAKEEAELRYQSRLQDVKDKLEQSDSTNHSLQNYIQFLKSSYASVFGDPALTGSSLQTPSPV